MKRCWESLFQNPSLKFSSNLLFSAVNSLKRIAAACSYPGITELIADNVDYLTNTMAWKLRDLKHNIVVFDVFCVIISFSQENSLSTLLDVMEVRDVLQSAKLLAPWNWPNVFHFRRFCWKVTVFFKMPTAKGFFAYSKHLL